MSAPAGADAIGASVKRPMLLASPPPAISGDDPGRVMANASTTTLDALTMAEGAGRGGDGGGLRHGGSLTVIHGPCAVGSAVRGLDARR